MIDFLAPLFGRQVVYLRDFDGEVTKRWAKPTPFGLVCFRMGSLMPVTRCLLLPGGKVKGPSFVDEWAPASSTEAEQ